MNGDIDEEIVYKLTPKGCLDLSYRKRHSPDAALSALARLATSETTEKAPIPAMLWIDGAWRFAAVAGSKRG